MAVAEAYRNARDLTDPHEARRIVRMTAAGAVVPEAEFSSPFLEFKAIAMVVQDLAGRVERLEAERDQRRHQGTFTDRHVDERIAEGL